MINAIFKAKKDEDSDDVIEMEVTICQFLDTTEHGAAAVAINNSNGQMFTAPIRFFIAQKNANSAIVTPGGVGG